MWQTILVGILSGLFGGGFIVGVIEILRYRRELSSWKKEEKQIEINLIRANQNHTRWENCDYLSDEEKVRLFESGLLNKINEWKFLVILSITNLTDHDILALEVYLAQPQPKLVEPKEENKKYFSGYKRQVVRRYDLLTKQLLEDIDLPLTIPAHGKAGIVFVGDFQYDYPNLVEGIPSKLRFIIKTDSNLTHSLEIEPENTLSFFYGDEVSQQTDSDEYHWVGYLEKNGIDHSLPF